MPHFSSKHPCSCGLTFNDHETVIETREEREEAGREVDPKWMQENNMIGGMGGLSSFTGLADGADIDAMRDPAAIMGNVQSSIGGYAALHALEGDHEESKRPGRGVVSKTKPSAAASESTNAYDLFHTPHNFGTRAIGAPVGAKKVGPKYSYK